MSGSSGGGGGAVSLPGRRSSSISFHAPSAHDLLRSAGSAPLEYRPTSFVTTDPLRRSDAASSALSFPPYGSRGNSSEFGANRLSFASGQLRRLQRSTEYAGPDEHFKVPGAPMGR